MTRKTLIIAILATTYLLVAVAGVAWMLYEVSGSGSALKERVAAIADKNAKVKAYTELSQLMEDTQGERTELQQYVLTESQTSRFLTDVEALGKKLGVDLATLSLEVDEKKDAFSSLLISFSVEGNEEQVKRMLKVLESLPYHSTVQSLSFSREQNGSVKSTIALSLTLLNYDK